MENLPTPKIYQIMILFLVILLGIGTSLRFFEKHLAANAIPEKIPEVSALGEIEFESGVTAQETQTRQMHELHSYAETADARDQKEFIQVPIERAMNQLVEDNTLKKNKEKEAP